MMEPENKHTTVVQASLSNLISYQFA